MDLFLLAQPDDTPSVDRRYSQVDLVMPSRPIQFPLLYLLLALYATLSTEVALPRTFGSNMVLQQDKSVPAWAWSNPGETVSISFHHQTIRATIKEDRSAR